MKCEACLPLVDEFFDGELEPRLIGNVRAHIAGCTSCSGYYQSLRMGQDVYDTFLEHVKLNFTSWQGVRGRIQENKIAGTGGILAGFFEKRNWLPNPRFQEAMVAATLGLVVFGFVTWRLAIRPEDNRQVATAGPTLVESEKQATPAGAAQLAAEQSRSGYQASEFQKPREAAKRLNRSVQAKASAVRRDVRPVVRPVVTSQALAMVQKAAAFSRAMESARSELEVNRPVTLKTDVVRHFEKTRLLLLSLKNTPISETETGVNVGYEKILSRKLANSNVLLRRETTTAGDRSAAELLDRIEPLLIEIANMPDRASRGEVALLSRRIAQKDVLGLLQSQAF